MHLSIEGDNALSETVVQVIQLVLNGGVLIAGAAVWGLYVKTLKANIDGAVTVNFVWRFFAGSYGGLP